MSLSRPNPSGSWKAIQHDYSELIEQPSDVEYFALSKRHQWLLLSLSEYAKWITRWFSSNGETPIDTDSLSAIVDDMIYRLMSPIGGEMMTSFQLRQNEEAPCLLEQSFDNGETWSLAFDYSLCQQYSILDYNIERSIVNQENARRSELYDGTPESINENCPEDFTGAALCSAVKHYVEIQVLDTLNRYRVAAALAAAAVGFLGLGAGVLGWVIGGIVVGLVGYELSQIEAAAADRDALNDVICALVDELEGIAVTEANFVAGITALAAMSGNAATVVAILKGNKGNQVNYLWFVDLLGEAFVATSTGYDDCPCSPEWCWNFDFTADNGGWSNASSPAYGVYSSGVGWIGTKVGSVYSAYLKRAFASRLITKVYITITCPGGITGGSNVLLLNGTSSVLLNAGLLIGEHTYVWEGEATSSELRINPNDTTINFTVTSITVWGRGENPFGEDNC